MSQHPIKSTVDAKVSDAAKARARCIRWLSSQCHAGDDCRCVPAPVPPKSKTAKPKTEPQESTP